MVSAHGIGSTYMKHLAIYTMVSAHGIGSTYMKHVGLFLVSIYKIPAKNDINHK